MTGETQTAEDRRSTPASLRLRSITPSLTVDDIDASLSWYRDVLGCHVEETWEEEGRLLGAHLKAGEASIMISQDDWAKGRDRTKGVGLRLHLSTVQDVDQLAEWFVERGGTLEDGPMDTPWGTRAFTVVDPDGFKLTISSAE